MKRDLDLVRAILLALQNSKHESVEEGELARKVMHSSKFSWTYSQLMAHIRILDECGLVTSRPLAMEGVSLSDAPLPYLVRLTWEGHEFIDNARNESVWTKAKEKAGSASFTVLKQLLVELAKQALKFGERYT